jgi:alpha-tubulin suppressor-like RCC1 family protein
LNLEDKVAYDGFGNKFTNRVSEYAGAKEDFSENAIFRGSIRVSSLSGTPISHNESSGSKDDGAAYVLISHGRYFITHVAWSKGDSAPNPSAITSKEFGVVGKIGNANHAQGRYYADKFQGVFDDTVYFKRKSAFFPPKQHVAPIAMDADICQNANIVLKSGSPRDVDTPLHALVANNPQMAELAEQMYITANQMKAICDASPLEVLQYVQPFTPETYVWGYNGASQLGLNDTVQRLEPTILPDFSFESVKAGFQHTLALTKNGELFSWGGNNNGELGLGDQIGRSTPTSVGTGWKYITTGADSSAGIKNDGTLWTWGKNLAGKLGIGNVGTVRTYPTQVGLADDWAFISVSITHTLALKEDGSLFVWGRNEDHELGLNDPTDNYDTPQAQVGTWKSVAAGLFVSIGIKTDGSMWAWGRNANGRTGLGLTEGATSVPTRIGLENDWKTVVSSNDHSIAQKEDGRIYGWGSNYSGQLGIGGTELSVSAPSLIDGGSADWKMIDVGRDVSVGVKNDSTIYTWGQNADGRTGHGITAGNTLVPTKINEPDTKWSSASISEHVIAIRSE